MSQVLSETPARLSERRLAGRVQKFWKELARDCLPSWDDIRALDLGEDWRFCFSIDLRVSDTKPYFVFLGEALSKLSALHLEGDPQAECDILDAMTAQMDEAALSKSPVCTSDHFRFSNGRRVAFRSTLMPLADNGVAVTHIFGALNGKGL